MIGRFSSQKDHANLIRSMSFVDRAELHLIGDGPYLSSCMQLVEDLNLSSKVFFTGRLSNVDAISILSKSNIYALISNWEGLPRSSIEALSFALPIIASDVGVKEPFIYDGTFQTELLSTITNPIHCHKQSIF